MNSIEIDIDIATKVDLLISQQLASDTMEDLSEDLKAYHTKYLLVKGFRIKCMLMRKRLISEKKKINDK